MLEVLRRRTVKNGLSISRFCSCLLLLLSACDFAAPRRDVLSADFEKIIGTYGDGALTVNVTNIGFGDGDTHSVDGYVTFDITASRPFEAKAGPLAGLTLAGGETRCGGSFALYYSKVDGSWTLITSKLARGPARC